MRREGEALFLAKNVLRIRVPRPCLSVFWRDSAGILLLFSNLPVLTDQSRLHSASHSSKCFQALATSAISKL